MQIQSNFNSYPNKNYDHNHTHHITKCLHEEQQERRESAAAGVRNGRPEAKNTQDDTKPETSFSYGNVQGRPAGTRKGIGFFKGIWDALGEKKTAEQQNILPSENGYGRGKAMEIISTSMRRMIPHRLINKLENTREKIRAGISATLKRFGKRNETGKRESAFGALSDPGGHFTGKRENSRHWEERKEKGTRQTAESVPDAAWQDSHLMDSYSKTGAYCRLNENLTYQKGGAFLKPEEQSVKGE